MVRGVIGLAVFMGAVPFLLGLLYTGFVEEEKENLLLHLAAGYVMMLGSFELCALPLIWLGGSLSLLLSIYVGLLAVASLLSLAVNFRRIFGVFLRVAQAARAFTPCIWGQLALLLGQALFYVRYQYSNADDAFYVASAATSLATNTVFAYSPYTGTAYETLPARYALSPFHAFNAVLCRLTGIHPAVMAHIVFMILFLLFAYAVYALLGRALFSKDMEKTGYFLLLVSALTLFSAYSERTSGLVLLIRLWQGKALLAGVLLPMALYLAVRIFLLDGRRADWLLLFALMCACCMASSMGVLLGALSAGIFGLLYAVRDRSVRPLVFTVLCCLPNVLCGALYLAMR